MRIESQGEVTATRKRQFVSWVVRMLEQPNLATDTTRFPHDGEVRLTVNGRPQVVMHGEWEYSERSPYLFVGTDISSDGRMSLVDKLTVLTALINYYNVWDNERVVEAYSKALTTVMLDTYNSFLHGAVQSKEPVTKLAFNEEEQKFAAYIGDGFYLPDGTKVDVEKGDWAVAA